MFSKHASQTISVNHVSPSRRSIVHVAFRPHAHLVTAIHNSNRRMRLWIFLLVAAVNAEIETFPNACPASPDTKISPEMIRDEDLGRCLCAPGKCGSACRGILTEHGCIENDHFLHDLGYTECAEDKCGAMCEGSRTEFGCLIPPGFELISFVNLDSEIAREPWIRDDGENHCADGKCGPTCDEDCFMDATIFDGNWPLKYAYAEYNDHDAHGPRADLLPNTEHHDFEIAQGGCEKFIPSIGACSGSYDLPHTFSEYPTIHGPEPMDRVSSECAENKCGPTCDEDCFLDATIFDGNWPLKYGHTEYNDHVAHGPRADLFPCDGADHPVCSSTGYMDQIDFKSKAEEPGHACDICGPTCDDCLEAGDN